MLLESGLVRTKNNINVAAKNILDLCLVLILFWFFGQHIALGTSFTASPHPNEYLAIIYQSLFCATCVTLISGAISERAYLSAYLFIALITSLIIYPYFAYHAWHPNGLLAQQGFVDLAGSSVVHLVGGTVALAALIVIGPRLDIYIDGVRNSVASNMPVAVGGGFLLFVGWLGFNGGASDVEGLHIPTILINTVFAGCSAGCFAILLKLATRASLDVKDLLNGILAGLVASSAAPHLLSPGSALILGVVSYLVMKAVSKLLDRLMIDDAVDAVAVHLGGGVVGVILSAIFVDEIHLSTQLIGCLAAFLWAFSVAFPMLWLINKITPLRVNEDAERLGLNIFEHGERNDLADLAESIHRNKRTGDYTKRLPENAATEVGVLAHHYNGLLSSIDEHQKELEVLLEESKRLQRVKDEFVSTLNHEIRTPITAVVGFAKQLKERFSSDEKVHDLSERIYNAGKKLEDLSREILSVERIEASSLEPILSDVDIGELCELLTIHCRTLFQDEAVECDIACDIQNDCQRLTSIDQTLFFDAVDAVLDNAIKFGDRKPVGIALCVDGEEFVVLVENKGASLEVGDAPYQKFWQADRSLSRAYAGLGLGLFIARRYLAAMAGSISHAPTHEGTEFRISVPSKAILTRDVGVEGSVPEQHDADETGRLEFEGKECLVVDDTLDNQILIEFVMAQLGFSCTTAENGQVAVDLVQQKNFDVVMMDMQMPVMDGVTATKIIRDELGIDANKLPIIALTANDLDEHRRQCLEAGMNDFLTKPLDEEKLRVALKLLV